MPEEPSILLDQDKRLREAENKITLFEGRIEQVLQAVEEIKEAVRVLTGSAASRGSLDKLETSVVSAHKRLDTFNKEFWKLQTEHVSCQKTNDAMASSLTANNRLLTDLQSAIKLLEKSVQDLFRDKDRSDVFWSTRLGTVVDKLIQLAPWAITMGYLYFKLNP